MTEDPAETIVAVLGAGTMGAGIAQLFLQHGFKVQLRDVDKGVLDGAERRIEDGLAKAVERGRLSRERRDAAVRALITTTDLAEGVRGAGLVIEAVPEDAVLKRTVLAEAEAAAADDAVLATNTSSLSVTELASGLRRPERFLGMHFFNPPYAMKLVEIVRTDRTADACVRFALAVANATGREPIVVKDSPGFASSRLGVALGLEAIRMLEEGVASAEDIDKAMELGYGHPMGPLKLTDHVGLDVRLAIAEHLHETLGGSRFAPPELLRQMVRDGKLGKKSGQGFYGWRT